MALAIAMTQKPVRSVVRVRVRVRSVVRVRV